MSIVTNGNFLPAILFDIPTFDWSNPPINLTVNNNCGYRFEFKKEPIGTSMYLPLLEIESAITNPEDLGTYQFKIDINDEGFGNKFYNYNITNCNFEKVH